MHRNSSETSPDDTPSRLPRVPEEFGGVQVNFCKNPSCANFGVPVSPASSRGKFADNAYTVVAAGKGIPAARCNSCGEHFPFKSNRGIYEEFWRIYRQTHPVASCPEVLCDHHRIPVDTPGAYQAFGQTTIGSRRYRCKMCGRTFSVKPAGPRPTMSEPEKAMCFLTDMGDYDGDHLAWLYNKASLHAVDSWFNCLRRRSSMLERPVSSAGNRGRVWSGYSAYRPEQIGKLMTIFRACHNYLWVGEGKDARQRGTPAMRLGLAKAPLDYSDIIYFR